MFDGIDTIKYFAAIERGGVVRRADRGMLIITGADRASWLSNLVTNVVKTLSPGEGNYAFCINVKGRVVFDMNILVHDEAIRLDVDRRWIETAAKWLERYHIVEDVAIADATAEQDRIAIVGPAAVTACAALGFGNLAPMSWLQHVTRDIDGAAITMFRHDFTGLVGAEFIVRGDDRAASIARIEAAARDAGAIDLEKETVDTLRIETGIPASLDDIDAQVIPPETMQVERGISYQKGCYLGQEVIERMRSRGSLARRLVGVRLDAATMPPRDSLIQHDGAEVGRVTSACRSPALQSTLALGYLKTAHATPGTQVIVLAGSDHLRGEIVKLPARS